MFKKLKLAYKIAIGFGVVIVLLCAVAWCGYSGVRQDLAALAEYRSIARDNIAVAEMNDAFLGLRVEIKDYTISRAEAALHRCEQSVTQVNEAIAGAKKEMPLPEEIQKLSQFESSWQQYSQALPTLLTAIGQNDTNSMAQGTAKMKPLGDSIAGITDDIRA